MSSGLRYGEERLRERRIRLHDLKPGDPHGLTRRPFIHMLGKKEEESAAGNLYAKGEPWLVLRINVSVESSYLRGDMTGPIL